MLSEVSSSSPESPLAAFPETVTGILIACACATKLFGSVSFIVSGVPLEDVLEVLEEVLLEDVELVEEVEEVCEAIIFTSLSACPAFTVTVRARL